MAQHSKTRGVASVTPVLAYAVVIEWGPHNYSAYVPDLPGCISTGKTVEETTRNIREAIELYLEPVEDDLAGKEGEIAQRGSHIRMHRQEPDRVRKFRRHRHPVWLLQRGPAHQCALVVEV